MKIVLRPLLATTQDLREISTAFRSNTLTLENGLTNTTSMRTERRKFTITMVWTTLILSLLVTLVALLLVFTMLMGWFKIATSLALLVTLISAMCTLKMVQALALLLAWWQGATKVPTKAGQDKATPSGGKV